MTFRRILVATDFSAGANEAVRQAARYAQPGSRYRVLHVVEPPEAAFPRATGAAARFARARKEAARRSLDGSLRKLEAPANGEVRAGKVGREVARAAEAFDADLVVVGARGATRLQRVLLGSRARTVLRTIRTSVLVAREGPGASSRGRLRRIAALTDFHEPAKRATARALALAKEHDATLHLVHALDPTPWGSYLSIPKEIPLPPPDSPESPQAVERAVRALLRQTNTERLGGIALEKIVRGQPAHAAPRLAAREKIDLLVLGTHGRSRLGRALLGSVAEAVAERAECSVLVVRDG